LQEQASKDWKPEVLAEEDNVFVLKTESMYDEFVSKNNLAILFFYAPVIKVIHIFSPAF
jgi:hypothetical protein